VLVRAPLLGPERRGAGEPLLRGRVCARSGRSAERQHRDGDESQRDRCGRRGKSDQTAPSTGLHATRATRPSRANPTRTIIATTYDLVPSEMAERQGSCRRSPFQTMSRGWRRSGTVLRSRLAFPRGSSIGRRLRRGSAWRPRRVRTGAVPAGTRPLAQRCRRTGS
jgi:hypothetical protein